MPLIDIYLPLLLQRFERVFRSGESVLDFAELARQLDSQILDRNQRQMTYNPVLFQFGVHVFRFHGNLQAILVIGEALSQSSNLCLGTTNTLVKIKNSRLELGSA